MSGRAENKHFPMGPIVVDQHDDLQIPFKTILLIALTGVIWLIAGMAIAFAFVQPAYTPHALMTVFTAIMATATEIYFVIITENLAKTVPVPVASQQISNMPLLPETCSRFNDTHQNGIEEEVVSLLDDQFFSRNSQPRRLK